jgi:mono/diheme cytochrome c family protein
MPARTIAIGALILTMMVLLAFGFRQSDRQRSAPGGDVANTSAIATGRRIYAQQCAACHGANLEGQPNWRSELPGGGRPAPPHDASGHTWHHSDQQLFELTAYGIPPAAGASGGGMPAFGGRLSDAEIRAVLAFIKSTWPDDIRTYQSQVQ